MKKINSKNSNFPFSDLGFRILDLSRISDFGFRIFFQRGISLVEVVIGTALILIAVVGLTSAYSFYLKTGLKNTDTLSASFLLEEGAETMKLLRDNGWPSISSLATNTPYFLYWNGTLWQATTTARLLDETFTRTVTVDDVFREVAGNDIVATTSPLSKTFDANTKMITVRVTTPTGLNRELITYLSNLFE